MKILITILLISTSVLTNGQIEKDINDILLKRDFNQFLEFASDYYNEKEGLQISKGNIREIATAYQEAMFTIIKSYKINKGVSITCNVKLSILTKNNRIIYFNLETKEIKDFPKNYNVTTDTTYHFADAAGMSGLKNRFETEYKTSLSVEDLFIDTIAVGTACGMAPAVTTSQYAQILNWVQAKDTASIFTWLQSVNTEKQVYAVKGLHHLKSIGLQIGEEKRSMARMVIRKKGTIFTCILCDKKKTLISEELENQEF